MNTITWKGVSSETIPGLLISELPPITKPEMRVRTTKIEGRDGDIVDELGYESYNKKIKIGLHGAFDIDAVIKYFTGSGKITFSNEPDKYYIARIINKVDYQRLIRYRTASVEFHVQPFKYKLNEAEIDETITSQEEITVVNSGLEIAKPKVTVYGTGEITIKKNGSDVFKIDMSDDEFIVIDSTEEEAYAGAELKNRQMTGQFLKLDPGENTITWTGDLSRIKIEPRSRWL